MGKNMYREDMVNTLECFYSENGITPDGFHCKNAINCIGNLARGMQCGIGASYGEKCKVLIVSLDCGSGGASSIEMRTEDIKQHLFNPHMKGTLYCASMLLNFIDPNLDNPWEKWAIEWKKKNKSVVDQAIPYFAMINSCKCCNKGTTNKLGTKYYRQCAEYKIKEIEILKPDIVIFQGKDAPIGCSKYFVEIETIRDAEMSRSLKKMVLGDRTMFAIFSIHPSARQKGRVKMFMNNTFPKIVNEIFP